MPIDKVDLVTQIGQALGALQPNLTTASDASDLYEAFVWSLMVRAARDEGATVTFHNGDGSVPKPYRFRTTPMHIHFNHENYGYALLQFAGKPSLEATVGIYTLGKSGVPHEADVIVLDHAEAATCRGQQSVPRSARAVIAVECKCWETGLKLNLGRAFLGLRQDLSADSTYFVAHKNHANIRSLLVQHTRDWELLVEPGSREATRLRHFFQRCFRDYKAQR